MEKNEVYGCYKNPVLYKDFSDPDVIRAGEDYYMVSSSFTYLPGVPVLHSKDLVCWELINYCVKELPFQRYEVPQHGSGTWAPSIRYHKGKFFVFIPLPDEGIFVTTADSPFGEWSSLHCLTAEKGWIDPCPFWEEDGKAYVIFAYAKSRCGIKHRLSICEMNENGQNLLSESVTVYDGTSENPTIEGPKLYKKDGYYYIFAPAGGVEEGWQTVLRSENIYGPYEARKVLQQGKTPINGPHQGGWVETPEGKGCFLHFQDAGPFGRIVHMQPLEWQDGWPVMGSGGEIGKVGEPVRCAGRPLPKWEPARNVMDGSDEFESQRLGLFWQWQANPRKEWYSLTARPGFLRLYTLPNQKREENLLWYAPNICTQMIPGPDLFLTASVELCGRTDGDMAGICVLGHRYFCLALAKEGENLFLQLWEGSVSEIQGEGLAQEQRLWSVPCKKTGEDNGKVWIRLKVKENAEYEWFYSFDEINYETVPFRLKLERGTWTGARLGLFGRNLKNQKSRGYGDFDYVRFREKEKF